MHVKQKSHTCFYIHAMNQVSCTLGYSLFGNQPVLPEKGDSGSDSNTTNTAIHTATSNLIDRYSPESCFRLA